MLQLQFYIANLGPMFYRFLAAASIIDGTLSILVIIFYRLYKYNNPSVTQGSAEEWDNPLIMILIMVLLAYLIFQIVVPILFLSGNFLT